MGMSKEGKDEDRTEEVRSEEARRLLPSSLGRYAGRCCCFGRALLAELFSTSPLGGTCALHLRW